MDNHKHLRETSAKLSKYLAITIGCLPSLNISLEVLFRGINNSSPYTIIFYALFPLLFVIISFRKQVLGGLLLVIYSVYQRIGMLVSYPYSFFEVLQFTGITRADMSEDMIYEELHVFMPWFISGMLFLYPSIKKKVTQNKYNLTIAIVTCIVGILIACVYVVVYLLRYSDVLLMFIGG